MHGPILVTGAGGKTGSRVAAGLTALGIPVLRAARSGPVPFDWTDNTTWAPALSGAAGIYLAYQPDLAFPGSVEAVAHFARLAAQSGVRGAVLLSGRGEPGAQAAERAFLQALPTGTVVRCSWFNQNFTEGALADGLATGVLALPCEPWLREPFVDADDIAEVAVAALTLKGHEGRVHELTGPRGVSFAEVAGLLSAALGRPVAFVPVTCEEFAAAAQEAGMSAEGAAALAGLFAEVLDGRNSAPARGVQDVLGREPRSFEDWARAAVVQWAGAQRGMP